MADCEFCHGPRLNGSPVTRSGDGWALGKFPRDRVTVYACRDCAKEKTGA